MFISAKFKIMLLWNIQKKILFARFRYEFFLDICPFNFFAFTHYRFVKAKMLVKKQMKYFDVPLDHAWKVPVLQELLNTRMNNLYVEGFDDYVITEMINMLCIE